VPNLVTVCLWVSEFWSVGRPYKSVSTIVLCTAVLHCEKSPTRLCPFSLLVLHLSGDGDDGSRPLIDFKVDYKLEGE